ncbi:ATP-binding protein [Alicyclobacillus mali (ex Roth et al. 2021)]|uniref:ATP-binding protein n=1 Tax=Alicyclobacillus mali (ex Roth et al. 2021) TaxID=1123961 RepID=UPI0027D7B616|nr:DUF499 domain-containing protein [Alicyclobacillus mali (ex Roth et al. 2021)]
MVMLLKPWREVAVPHEDVLRGTFQQSEFAADLTRVHNGTATDEYKDPKLFYARTYITEGMRLLLDSIVRRLCSLGGEPVVQLQTAFGGGKTHTLLAVYHLAKGEVPLHELQGVGPIVDAVGVVEVPKARVVVLDGNQLSPNQPQMHDGQPIRTMWGELAWQLGKRAAYERIRESDESGTSPGKGVLSALLEEYAPCVILMDELVAYLRQFEEGRQYAGGTFESNLSFIQALTEAVKAVPNAMVLASLPESELELGGPRAQLALDSLEKIFGRVQALWKPVGAEEAFEIVRRRLFSAIADERAMEETCQAYMQMYLQHAGEFPSETQESRYLERLRASYPIHPAVFDALYNVWSSMDKFQRTRGVLRLMAKAIHKLWTDGNTSPMIQPADLPIDFADVRNDLLYYLPQGWDPVVERDVDGPRSETARLDRDTRFGAVQAARRVARTIFLSTAPEVPGQAARGIEIPDILLGCMQPGQTVGVYKDVLRRMSDTLHYLNVAGTRYFYDTRPNLRREMESRKQRFGRDETEKDIRDRITKWLVRRAPFEGVHVFTSSADVPDDERIRLVVLPTEAAYSRSAPEDAQEAAKQILTMRGTQPRLNQNRLLFLAADYDVVQRLRDHVRTALAWASIQKDVAELRLNLDVLQQNQVKQQLDTAQQVAARTLRDAYKWMLIPYQEVRNGKGLGPLLWEAVMLSSSAANTMDEICNKLKDNEFLIETWSPVHLKPQLEKWFWKEDKSAVSAFEVWRSMCRYVYLDRLTDMEVLRRAIEVGVRSGAFGIAYAEADGEYRGFAFEEHAPVAMDESLLLIEPQEARAYAERKQREAQQARVPEVVDTQGGSPSHAPLQEGSLTGVHRPVNTPATGTTVGTYVREDGGNGQAREIAAAKRRFYGTVQLNAMTSKMEFSTIFDEILKHFTSRPDVQIELTVDISARSEQGFDEGFQRIISENMRQLKFQHGEFEEE